MVTAGSLIRIARIARIARFSTIDEAASSLLSCSFVSKAPEPVDTAEPPTRCINAASLSYAFASTTSLTPPRLSLPVYPNTWPQCAALRPRTTTRTQQPVGEFGMR